MGMGGCENEKNSLIEDPVSIENPGTLLGTWYWKKTYTMNELSDSNPQTPQNSGITQSLILKNDSSWTLIEKNKTTNGDKFTIGKGIYNEMGTPIEYDSICLYQDNKIIKVDYYKLYGNTLDFCYCFKGGITGGVTRWQYISTN